MSEIVLSLLALLLLAAAGVLFRLWRQAEQQRETGRQEQQAAAEQLAGVQARADEAEKQRQQLQAELERTRAAAKDEQTAAQNSSSEQSARIAELEAELKNEQKNAGEKIQAIQQARDEMQAQFKNLAQTVLEEKSKKFSEDTQQRLAPLLNPLNQNLQSFRERIEALHGENQKERGALKNHIESLQQNASDMSAHADNLTKALTGGKKIQGDWGEQMLATLLENSGLEKDQNYRLQPSYKNDEGSQRRPDAVIYLPEGKHLIIDAKVSLTAYAQYTAAETDEARQEAVKSHLVSVRAHVERLCEANYSALPALDAPDFVLMFMPVEPAFILALQEDNTLFSDAYKKKVVLISPSTLLPVLRTVAHIWSVEKQQQNTQAIAEQGGKLYDKFCGFYEDMEKIGKAIEQTQKSFEAANNKLSQGRGNLVAQAEKLRGLGVTPKKGLPRDVVAAAEESEALPQG